MFVKSRQTMSKSTRHKRFTSTLTGSNFFFKKVFTS